MNKHGFIGVRKYSDGRGKPFYFRIQVGGQRYETPAYVTAAEAADAGKAMRRLMSRMRKFPPCTCGEPRTGLRCPKLDSQDRKHHLSVVKT